MFKIIIGVSVATGPAGVNSLDQVIRLGDGAAHGRKTLSVYRAGAVCDERCCMGGCAVAFVLGKAIAGIGSV